MGGQQMGSVRENDLFSLKTVRLGIMAIDTPIQSSGETTI
jgi:hypothetical protein